MTCAATFQRWLLKSMPWSLHFSLFNFCAPLVRSLIASTVPVISLTDSILCSILIFLGPAFNTIELRASCKDKA